MDLHTTPDQDEIADGAARYLAGEFPTERMPSLSSKSLSDAEWRGLAEMGWFAMALPEEAGGLGLSVIEEALVMREFGRVLLPPSTLGTMLAGHLAHALGDEALTGELLSGERRVAIAVPVDGAAGDGPSSGAYQLVDSDGASLAIGWSASGAFLAPVEAFANRTAVKSLDASIELTSADSLDAGQARWLDEASGGINARGRLLTAALLTGGAEAVRDLSAIYVRERQQFGRPIGSFQAVAHPCADMAVRSEAALATLYYAAVCHRDDLSERETYGCAAFSVAADAAYSNAKASMQVHGGYGQTYEYLPHFYLKRAMIYELVGAGVRADEAQLLLGDSLL